MQPRSLIRRRVLKRPLWRNYLTAYLLIGGGFILGDVAGAPPANRVLEVAGATIGCAGLLVFISAVAHSIWSVLRKKKPAHGICLKCGYDLRATPDRCPECGTVPAISR
jgi:hypothetical protein